MTMATIGTLIGNAKVKEVRNNKKNVTIPNRLKNKKVMKQNYDYYTTAEETAIQELLDYGFAKNRNQAINTLVSEGKLVKERTGAGKWLEGHGGFWGLIEEAQTFLQGEGVEEGDGNGVGNGEDDAGKGMPTWVWIVIIVVALAVIIGIIAFLNKKK